TKCRYFMKAVNNIESPNKEVSEERYRSLIEASLDPLVTVGPDGCITDLNEAFASITGLSREQLNGSALFTHFVEKDISKELFKEVLSKGAIANHPLTLKHAEGKHKEVLFNG